MTWTTQAYCLLADVKLALDPNLTGVDDTFLNSLILTAQMDLDAEIGYSFQQDGTATTPATRLYDGLGLTFLATDDLISLYGGGGCTPTPCGAVFETATNSFLGPSGFWITGTPVTTDITADIILKPNNYAAMGIAAHGMTRNSGLQFAQGNQNYKVLGIFGQPINAWGQIYPGVPADITRACIRLVIFYYKMRDTNYADLLQEQGGIREKFLKLWPVDVQRIVRKYQRTRFLTR